jgi:hypothetical protein
MGGNSAIPEGGCLANYGADRLELGRRAPVFVDKILRGANPEELPIEQASKFDLNLRGGKGVRRPDLARGAVASRQSHRMNRRNG